MKSYIYTIVRTDLPTNGDIVAQAIHSAWEAGVQHGIATFEVTYAYDKEGNVIDWPAPHVVVLGVKNQKKLYEAADLLKREKINFYLWEEPEWGFGHTSLTTQPLDESKKNLFKSFKILNPC